MGNENAPAEHSIGVREAPPPAPVAGRRPYQRKGSLHLSIAQLENIWAAFGSSVSLGLRPTETLDIHFDVGDLLDPHRWARPCLREFLKSARQWIERRGHQTAYIWALENRGDGDGHGIHAHVLIHVPDILSVRFHQLKARWARRAGLNMANTGVIHREAIPTVKAAKGKLQYMSKDLDPKHWHLFQDISGRVHLDDRQKPSDQPIYGKKCGVSRNIDVKARQAYRAQLFAEPSNGLAGGVG